MSKYQTKAKTQKAYNKNRASENIIPANCVAVFPMLIVSGSTYITEHGTMPQNLIYDKGSFLFWQEVFDGRSSIKIQWDGAITLEKPIGENYYLAEPKVGKYFFGKPISSGTESLEIGDDASFEEFITMRANQQVKVRFEFDKSNRIMFENLKEDLRFVDNDLYKLYLIPEICEGKLMYISDYEEIYEDKSGLSYACEITFQALGNELQKSGKAVEQYPQWSAPGEFYVKPKIEYSVGNVREKRITIDQRGLNPVGIKYLQVELQGPALTSCMYALGRRQEKDPTTGKWKIGASHHLLGYQFVATQPNPLNRTSVPTKNFVCFHDEEVSFATNLSFMKDVFEYMAQPLEQTKNGGLITLGIESEWKDSKPESGIHNSNDPDDNNGSRFDYYDNTWFPLSYLTDSTYTVSSNGCVYAEATMDYYKNNDRMIDIMNKNVFTFNQQPIIPLSMYSTRPVYLRNIPLIGSIANFFSLGDIHLNSHTLNRKTTSLIYFGDADLCAMCANLQAGKMDDALFSKSGRVAFPINFFGNNETSYNKLGVNSVNTTFCIELTDNVLIQPAGESAKRSFNTLYLGQSTYEDGTPIFPDEPDRTLLVNGSLQADAPYEDGYIIDAVIVQTIFDGKIRISAYSIKDENLLIPEWTTTILSNANWQGGAMRDWTNMYILSNWTDRFCRQQDEFTYPLPPRKKETDGDYILQTNFASNFNTGDFKSSYSLQIDGTWSEVDEQRDNNYNCSRVSEEQEYYKTYLELGIDAITDKPSFIEYFENIQVNCQSSQVVFHERNKDPYISQFNELFRTIGKFERGKDTYSFDIYPVGINDSWGECWTNLNLPSSQDTIFTMFWQEAVGPGIITTHRGKLGINTCVSVVITLEEAGIRVQLDDKTKLWGYNWSGSTPINRYTYLGSAYPPFTVPDVQIIFNLFLNQVKFVRRDTQLPYSNSVYAPKRTKTPLKSTKTKK